MNSNSQSSDEASSPLRSIRRRRRMSLAVVADRAGISKALLSLMETGQIQLKRIDHITALASVLRVDPSELVESWPPGFGEQQQNSAAFPVARNDVVSTRHVLLADELARYMSSGDGHATGIFLRRIARDPSVNPWLLLDQIAAKKGQCGESRTLTGKRLLHLKNGGPDSGSLKDPEASTDLIGARLKAARKERLWPARKMAEMLRSSASDPDEVPHIDSLVRMIRIWEKGDRKPSEIYRMLYCKVFSMSEAELFEAGSARETRGLPVPIEIQDSGSRRKASGAGRA